ncbi:hypothetical protein HYDPIDRAFT_110118 [Hydnomerulius pinastri MD-312]|nr:hypothetical protein HYDPIDRAFT_110118 [Hydnomerulius pinastri MD-312]
MSGRPKSQTKKSQILSDSERQEEVLADAVNTYREEQQKPEEEKRSLCMRMICRVSDVEGK